MALFRANRGHPAALPEEDLQHLVAHHEENIGRILGVLRGIINMIFCLHEHIELAQSANTRTVDL